MPLTHTDGSVLYWGNDNLSGVTLNGASVWDLTVREVKRWPDGWGYVVTEKPLGEPTATPKVWPDNQTKRYTYYGKIEITP